MPRVTLRFLVALLLSAAAPLAQQVPDAAFTPVVAKPEYQADGRT